jgi:hypothetical protein
MSLAQLSTLSAQVQSSDPKDRQAHARHLDRLCELSVFVRGNGTAEVAACLLAAGHALQALAGADPKLPRGEVHGIVCALMDVVVNTMKFTAPGATAAAAVVPAGAGAPPASASKAPAVQPTVLAPSAPAAPTPRAPIRPEPPPKAAGQRPALALRDEVDDVPPLSARRGVADGAQAQAPNQAPKRPKASTFEPEAAAERFLESMGLVNQSGYEVRDERDSLLGRMLLRMGYVTRIQLARALRMHRKKRLPVGECMLLLGACAPDLVLEVMKLQEETRTQRQRDRSAGPAAGEPRPKAVAGAPAGPRRPASFHVTKDMFLGEVLLGLGMITSAELEQAMHLHHHWGLQVGAALIRIGALTEEDIVRGLELQRHLQSVATVNARKTSAGPDSGS